MLCNKCGHQLPCGAKFCMECGTPLEFISQTNTKTTINEKNHIIVPAMCPNCNAHMKVDTSTKIACCYACGTECFVQDAIKSLNVNGNVEVSNATININGTNIDRLLQRVELMIEDCDFSAAIKKCDTILDSDPTNGRAYFFMLMSVLRCSNQNELASQTWPFDKLSYYIKAMQYGDDNLKTELQYCKNATYDNLKNIQNSLNRGSTINFGQLNNERNINWRVLKIHNNKALIISNDIICTMPFHESETAISWSNCTLRKWLNNDFYNECFNLAEKTRIIISQLNNNSHPDSRAPNGTPTNDKVFLLSINEAHQLFGNYINRQTGSWWWLRSPGFHTYDAALVKANGDIQTNGFVVNDPNGVRPAMWINLDP